MFSPPGCLIEYATNAWCQGLDVCDSKKDVRELGERRRAKGRRQGSGIRDRVSEAGQLKSDD